ncbi:MAG: S46 family peptidase [Bacteroidales bacterium]|jgi:hypothetical protein|nr:S46 family peptidase [Bacteroidales bacterium]
MKRIFIGIALVASCLSVSKADEGMWLLPLLEKLNIGEMQKMGCELTADQIYSINHSSLKDAVAMLGSFCTCEMISAEGLILTNHHCGYGSIQEHSSPEHDYLKDGFWAKTREEEIPISGLTVTFLIRIEDVTARIDSVCLPEMTDALRTVAIKQKIGDIKKEVTQDNQYEASVESFFGGNRYYLLVYEEFPDVRMVGAPPSSIGKFGADTDNWMWPRHTGDFSLFRVYADSTGKPAACAPGNIPLKPRHHLPISLKGVEKNDFTMILGYPGNTERYATSYEVTDLLKNELPNRVKIRGKRQEIMMKHMSANDAVRIKYAAKYSQSTNYWKNAIGMMQGIRRLKVYERKAEQEQHFIQWLENHPEWKTTCGEALSMIKTGIEQAGELETAMQYVSECFFQGAELMMFSLQFNSLLTELKKKKPDDVRLLLITEYLRQQTDDFYKDYNAALDRDVTAAMFQLYRDDIAPAYHPAFYQTVEKKYGGDIHRYMQVYFKSFFTDAEKVKAFLQKPSAKMLEKDPVLQAGKALRETCLPWMDAITEAENAKSKGHRLYIAGLQAMEPEKKWYPDANFTMRLSYGSIQDYFPRDAVYYNYYTTLQGVMEKEDPNNWEFVVPDRLKELYALKDYGPYANRQGELPLCFISTNDITGGNSGSPVINGKGQLVGLAFDGNWEAMSGDIVFEPDLQRTISVDIRYVLFIIDKFAGAKHLIDEMTLVR